MKRPILGDLTELNELCPRYGVRRMYLFGSACSDRFDDESDIDLLVEFEELPVLEYGENYFRLLEALRILFGRKIDLVTKNSLSNPYFIESVEKTKRLIYGPREEKVPA